MIPLFASALASVAGNVVQSWRQPAPSAQGIPQQQFEALMQRNGMNSAQAATARLNALRQKLLSSPEIQTVLGAADPSRMPKLSLGGEGQVRVTGADGRTTQMTLSGEGAATARELRSAVLGQAGMMGGGSGWVALE